MKLKAWKFIVCSVFIILGIVAVVFGSNLRKAYRNRPQDIKYPSGLTSQDIYTQQNYEYVASNNFKSTYLFENFLYKIDSPTFEYAYMGNGIIYKNNAYNVYTTECKADSLFDSINSEYIYAVSSVADPEKTDGGLLYKETGYINSFKVDFRILQLVVTDENENKFNRYMVGYLIDIPEENIIEQFDEDGNKSETPTHIWISAVSPVINTDELATLRDYVYQQLLTLRYNAPSEEQN